MKVLFIGDVHVKFNNLESVEKMTTVISSVSVSLIVIAGDVLDTYERINTQLLNKAYELINCCRKKAPTFVLVGNHDFINNSQFLTTNHWMNGMKEWDNVWVVDSPIFYSDFLFMPYVPVGRFIEALNTTGEKWKKVTCIFAHQEFKGCKMGFIKSQEGDRWNTEWPQVISGHIHERQWVENVFYPGSCINHSFSADNQGLSIFTFNPFVEERVKLNLQKKQIKNISFQDIKTITETNLLKLNQHTKLCAKGSLNEIVAFKKSDMYKNLMTNKIKIVFRTDEQQTTSTQYKEKTFHEVLFSLLQRENDPNLEKDYNELKCQHF